MQKTTRHAAYIVPLSTVLKSTRHITNVMLHM
ncbi:hypothetical protein PP653_gp001 [Bacillus phage Basilisk]|uniref:Uncharacterized protein n=1 Tax=Bacillus phage Basilisk TaxID=1296654 RepID=S5M8B1_9CAUD|nr:hypothetical protein PP653_gp001 [Bacillus phage Basilisk]AGR46718.1 hypothetical protein BASILISK_1 [Bacillus phage Basilisk]